MKPSKPIKQNKTSIGPEVYGMIRANPQLQKSSPNLSYNVPMNFPNHSNFNGRKNNRNQQPNFSNIRKQPNQMNRNNGSMTNNFQRPNANVQRMRRNQQSNQNLQNQQRYQQQNPMEIYGGESLDIHPKRNTQASIGFGLNTDPSIDRSNLISVSDNC